MPHAVPKRSSVACCVGGGSVCVVFARTEARSFATTLGAALCDCCFAIDALCECVVVCCKSHVLVADVVHWFASVVHVPLCL